jgi:hypothetical protein
MGSAGVEYGPKPEQLPQRREGDAIHFGMEWWEVDPYAEEHAAPEEKENFERGQRRNRALLTLFADRLVQAGVGQ